MGFFLEDKFNSKFMPIKTKGVVIYNGNNNGGNNGYCGQRLRYNVQWSKVLETIITEASFFFYLGFLSQTFTINRTTTGGRGRLSLYSLWETKLFGQRIYREIILNDRTNGQIKQRRKRGWGGGEKEGGGVGGRSFINSKCIFQ